MGQSTIHNCPPLVLTVPGIDNSGPLHWQSVWERERPDCKRADLGAWSRPHRNSWVTALNREIRQASRPVVLAAHSLGCLAAVWWAALETQPFGFPVAGALLVAPPDVDSIGPDARLAAFGPAPKCLLPFPSIVIASANDSHIDIIRAHSLAKFWGSHFVDIGNAGQINAESGLGDWKLGQFWLDSLLHVARTGAHDGSALSPASHGLLRRTAQTSGPIALES